MWGVHLFCNITSILMYVNVVTRSLFFLKLNVINGLLTPLGRGS